MRSECFVARGDTRGGWRVTPHRRHGRHPNLASDAKGRCSSNNGDRSAPRGDEDRRLARGSLGGPVAQDLRLGRVARSQMQRSHAPARHRHRSQEPRALPPFARRAHQRSPARARQSSSLLAQSSPATSHAWRPGGLEARHLACEPRLALDRQSAQNQLEMSSPTPRPLATSIANGVTERVSRSTADHEKPT